MIVTPSLSLTDYSHFEVSFSSALQGMDQDKCDMQASFRNIESDHYHIDYSCPDTKNVQMTITYKYKILNPIIEITFLKTTNNVYDWKLSTDKIIKNIPANKQEDQ